MILIVLLLAMGVVVSRFKSKNDDNYEKILSELDDNIRKAEISLGEIRKRGNKALIVWIVYSLLAYIAYVIGYWYFIYMSNQGEGFDFMKVAPVVTGPFFIVVGCKFLNLWYKRNETNEASQLEHLRAKQKLKLEEMKKRTSYYLTKTLLDRYDSPTNSPINQQQQPMTPGQKITSMTTPGSLKHGTPNSLRQRLPPNNNNDNDNNGDIDRQTSRPSSSINQTNWYDKLVDVVAGEDEQQYALICKDCYTWNGLAFPAEFDDIQYYCKNCNHFNPSRKSLINGTVLAPQSQPLSKSKSLSPSNGNIDASIVDSSSPRRGRSTSPKPTSRDSSSDPETLNEKYDGYDDDGIAVSEKKGSHCRADDNDNDDDDL